MGRRFRVTFQISDCLAGAVPNSYPKVDLLWDTVDCGANGPALKCKRESRPVAYPLDGSGTLRYANQENFQFRNATPRW